MLIVEILPNEGVPCLKGRDGVVKMLLQHSRQVLDERLSGITDKRDPQKNSTSDGMLFLYFNASCYGVCINVFIQAAAALVLINAGDHEARVNLALNLIL